MKSITWAILASSAAAYSIPSGTRPYGAAASSRPKCGGIKPQNDTTPGAEYDYVIVGGGIAGITLANRLTETGENQVLVLEAGELDQNEAFITTPGSVGSGVGTSYDWNLTSAASPGSNNREVNLPSGRGVGGGSLINQMVFTRGNRGDFDRWEAFGNEGVNWDDMLENFKKSENFTPPALPIVEEFGATFDLDAHGFEGAVQSTYPPFYWPSVNNIAAATRELGIPVLQDGQGGNNAGGYFCPKSQKPVENTRSSARAAHYEQAVGRPNFHLTTGAHVTKIQLEGTKAVGVEYAPSAGSERINVKARKEIILSAGALQSPKILQLSGIGDAATLSAADIEVAVELPGVGHNLQDHPLLALVFALNLPLSSANLTSNAAFAAEAAELYQTQRTGPLANPGGEFLLFLPVSNFTDRASELQTVAQSQDPASLVSTAPETVQAGFAQQHSLLTETLTSDSATALEILWGDGAIILGVENPFSRGSVKIASNDPFAPPVIDTNYFSNPIDLAVLVEGVKFARTIMATQAMAEAVPFEIVPGANVTSDASIEAFIKENVATFAHYSGTTTMGPLELGGVVDTSYRVYGVENLRVVDAGVIPMVPAAHTSTTVYALAERAAALIQL
ncbi:choline dehydrogenase [Plectosphaerella plurivora]|uniref:Choline dehydrogenase n=1 Tax=Plectosphaerella plurivora TaxID=936078 RepID=A0A9P8VMR0_9PEZI|nr:choline dehydrogenase [Plectosphaerella plurivora]